MNRYSVVPALATALLLVACSASPPPRPEAPLVSGLEGVGAGFDPDDLAPVDAPPGAPQAPVSTAEAVDWALRHHPEVHEVLAELDVGVARRWQAGLLPNPMLSVMALRGSGGGWMLEYGLMQSLVAVIERPRRVAEADAALERDTAVAVTRLLAIARRAEAAQVAAVAAVQRERLEMQRVALVEQRLLLLQREQAQGRVDRMDVLALERELLRGRERVELAALERVERMSALALAMGLSRASGLQVPETLQPPPMADIDEAVMQDLAERRRPELRATAAERERAGEALGLAGWNRGMDAIDLGLKREPGMLGPELRLALPVFDQARAREAGAAASLRSAVAREHAVHRSLGVEVEQAVLSLLGLQARLEAIESAHGRALDQARLALRMQAAGALSTDEALRADTGAIDSELDVVRARLALWDGWLALATATATALGASGAEASP